MSFIFTRTCAHGRTCVHTPACTHLHTGTRACTRTWAGGTFSPASRPLLCAHSVAPFRCWPRSPQHSGTHLVGTCCHAPHRVLGSGRAGRGCLGVDGKAVFTHTQKWQRMIWSLCFICWREMSFTSVSDCKRRVLYCSYHSRLTHSSDFLRGGGGEGWRGASGAEGGGFHGENAVTSS